MAREAGDTGPRRSRRSNGVPPADPDEIQALRRTIDACREVLSAAAHDRATAPRLPGYVIAAAGPTEGLGARANQPIGHLDDENSRPTSSGSR